MELKRIYFVFASVLIVMIAFMNSCTEDKTSETVKAGPLSEASGDSRIAELLASMNMHHFTEPQKAPEFELSSLTKGMISLSQFRGNVVLLSFWTTW